MNRKQLYAWLVHAPACIIAMEACAGAHWLARKCRSFGHQTRLIAPQFVRPFVNGKQERRRCASHLRSRLTPVDALCRAKTPEQQVLLALHRVRAAHRFRLQKPG
ncbi:transposase [Paraburkholderia caribensis]|nr:transposase [Paraburkholderia caribensis]